MNYFMVPILVVITILAIRGTIYNYRTKNKPGYIIGGLFTAGILGITLLALYDFFVGIQ